MMLMTGSSLPFSDLIRRIPWIGACGAHTTRVPYLVPLLANATVWLE